MIIVSEMQGLGLFSCFLFLNFGLDPVHGMDVSLPWYFMGSNKAVLWRSIFEIFHFTSTKLKNTQETSMEIMSKFKTPKSSVTNLALN